jgi:hypothetical protein
MKSILAIALIALCLAACSSYGSGSGSGARNDRTRFTEDEKHRLYTAALAASDSPLESETFKEVCKAIGIFDPGGAPNDNYLPFVSAHVDWAMKAETEQFKQEINTKEKAREYVSKHLP